ncbi:MAG: DUF418 domain-containing protein [Bacteroidota bacterium]
MSASLHPTLEKERIQSLDILRGIAILGILIMNIQGFAMPGAAYLNPTAFGDLTGVNYWVWMISHVFADQKFMTIFSILFGAGVVLVTQKAEQREGKSAGLHYKRTFWLLIIGLLHAHLIWYGDILVAYALCAFIVFLFRKLSARKLFIFGLTWISVHTLIYLFFGYSLQLMPAEALEELRTSIWNPGVVATNEEISAVTGSLPEQITHNSEAALTMQTMVFATVMFWRAGGLMLVGMALYKWGVLSASRSAAFYKRGMILGFLTGLPIIIWGVVQHAEADWAFEYSMFGGSQFNYYGSLGVSFAYICAIMLFAKSRGFQKLKERFAAIGQMALTNYIMQSVIGVFLFYGVGFGLFAQFERYEQVFVVFGIWVLQFLWSKHWLTRFRFGPLEWVWRSLTYWKFQPMKKNVS